MLRVLRDNLRYLSWILWAVILIFVFFVFAEWGGAGQGLQGGQAVALKVDGEVITFPELDRAHRNLQQTYGRLYGGQIPAEIAQRLQLPVQAVQQLVRQRLMVQEANAAGLVISDQELGERMLELPVFRNPSGEYIGDENYQQAVRSLGYPSPKNFEAAFRQDLLVEKLTSMMRDTVDITEESVETTYRREQESARIDYLLLDSNRFLTGLDAQDNELEAFFAANTEDFRIPEKRVVRYLLVDPAEIRNTLAIDDAQVEADFQANADEYRREERVRARQILLLIGNSRDAEQARAELTALQGQIQAGADFAELATLYSEDPASKDNGGDMGYFARGEILPEVENVAFASTPGEVVGPIQTSFGLHLIEVLDKQAGGLPPFEEIKEQVRGRMLNERAVQVAAEKAAALATAATSDDDTGSAWAATAENETGVSYTESSPFGRTEPIPGLGFSPQFADTAFSLEAGTPSGAIPIGQAWAILDLVRIDPPRIPELSEVQAAVRNQFLQSRSLELAVKRLDGARTAVEGGRPLKRVAGDLNIEVSASESFNRDGNLGDLGQPDALIEAALTGSEGDLVGPFETSNGAVLARVAERVQFDREAYLQARDQTEQQLREEQASRLLESLISRRQGMADIDYSPDLNAQLENLG